MLSPLQKICGRRSAAGAQSVNIEARSSLNPRNRQSDLGKLSEIKKTHSKLAKYEYIVSSQRANKKQSQLITQSIENCHVSQSRN